MNAHQRRKARRASKPNLPGLLCWWKDGKNMLPPPAMQLHATVGHAPMATPGVAR